VALEGLGIQADDESAVGELDHRATDQAGLGLHQRDRGGRVGDRPGG